jgi:hypothetical protein
VRQLRDGEFGEDSIAAVAPILGLDAASLIKLARNEWQPEEIAPIDGLAQFNTSYRDMTVNAYLVWDPASRTAAAFDTGADCSEMLKRAAVEDLSFTMILLTHAHPDHVEDLDRLRGGTGAPVYVPENEPVNGATIIGAGEEFDLGALSIEARLTSGHSRGGLTYVVTGSCRGRLRSSGIPCSPARWVAALSPTRMLCATTVKRSSRCRTKRLFALGTVRSPPSEKRSARIRSLRLLFRLQA